MSGCTSLYNAGDAPSCASYRPGHWTAGGITKMHPSKAETKKKEYVKKKSEEKKQVEK